MISQETETEDVFASFVASLVKPGSQIQKEITPGDLHLWHMATGVSGEAGELLDAIKKHVVYCKPLDLENVIEELGDLEFYMEAMRSHLGVSRQETIDHCKAKLAKRFPNAKYSNTDAIARKDKG